MSIPCLRSDHAALAANDLYLAVIIAVAIVRVVQVTVDEIVDVIAVRNCFMTAAWAMNMVRSVTCAAMAPCAGSGIGRVDIERMLLDAASARLMVQMAIVQIVHMVFVFDCGMSALSAVLVVVICVLMTHSVLILYRFRCGFAAVSKSVFDQVLNVRICQSVENVLSLPPLLHQPL